MAGDQRLRHPDAGQPPQAPSSETPRRAHFIGAPEFFDLNQACIILYQAYPESLGVYLVGSSLVRRDYRDVDLRLILHDEDYARMFPGITKTPWRHARWSLVCSSIATWLSKMSGGLKIDFQFQSMTEANTDYPSAEHQRNAIGVFLGPSQEQRT